MKKISEIDRESYEPAYAQLVKIIKQQIASGDFLPGSQLPSESSLCRSFGISPMTVRRAINLLLEQDIVKTIQGRGTFVKGLDLGNLQFDLRELKTLFQDKELNRVKILETRIVSAQENIARKLEISTGKRVIFLRRLMFRESDPLLYHIEYLKYDPKSPIVEAQMDVTSLTGLFQSSEKSDIKKGILTISATLLEAQEAALLNAKESSPAMRLEHTFFSFDNRTVSFGWFIFPAEKINFSAKVGIWD